MSMIKRLSTAYSERQTRRYNEAIREDQARSTRPEQWQCERCALIVPAHLDECPACPTRSDLTTLMIIQGEL